MVIRLTLFLIWLIYISFHYYSLNNVSELLPRIGLFVLLIIISMSTIFIVISMQKIIYRKKIVAPISLFGLILVIVLVFLGNFISTNIFLVARSIIILIWIMLIALLVGQSILERAGFKFWGSMESIVFSSGLGLGLFSYIIFAIASIHLINKNLLISILIIISLFFIIKFWCFDGKDKYIDICRVSFARDNIVNLMIILFIVSIVLFNLLNAITPETEYDALRYHLGLPRIYADNGGLVNVKSEVMSGLPQLLQMLYTLALVIDGEILAKLIHFSFGILTVGVIYSIGKRYFDRNTAILAGAIFYSMPVVAWESSVAYVDLGLGFFGIVCVYALLNWWSTTENKWLWLSAIMLGFTMGVKYQGVYLFVACLLVIIIILLKKKVPLKVFLTTTILFVAISGAVYLPWIIKDFVFTGNPVFPFMNNIFHSKYWFPENPQFDRNNFGIGNNLWSMVVLSLWYMNFDGPKYAGLIGPLIIATLPFFVLIFKKCTHLKILLGLSLVYYILWVLGVPIIRYFTPILPILSLVAASSINYLFHQNKGSTYLYINLLGFVIFSSILVFSHPLFSNMWFKSWVPGLPNSSPPLKVIAGFESYESYLSRVLNNYSVIEFANQNLTPQSRILFIGTSQGIPDRFHMKQDIVWEWSPEGKPVRQAISADEAAKAMEKNNIEYLLVDRNSEIPEIFSVDSDFSNKYLKLLYSQNNVLLYELGQTPENNGEFIFFDFLSKGIEKGNLIPLETWGDSAPPPRYMTVNINGDKRGAFVQIAPSKITFKFILPNRPTLKFALGMDNFKLGDGAIAEIYVKSDGVQKQIFSKTVTPQTDSEDRKWQEYAVNLDQYANKDINLIFVDDPGQKRDATADWLSWADLRITGER